MNTINSPEYKILKYLYDNNSADGIEFNQLKKETRADGFDDELKKQKDKKHIKEIFPKNEYEGFRLILTEEGRIRLEKMETDVEIEKIQLAVSRNTDATNKLAERSLKANIWIAIFTIVSGLCMILQLYYINKQTNISEKQLELEYKYKKLESHKKSSEPKNHNLKIEIQIK